MDLKGVAGLGEEFSAAGRGGGEDEHRVIIAKTAELALLAEFAWLSGALGSATQIAGEGD
jgi:hypothetical protein